MFIQGTTQKIPSRTGILLARRSSDRNRKKIYDAKIFPHPPGLAIALEHPRFSNTTHRISAQLLLQDYRQYSSLASSKYYVYYSLVCVNVIQTALASYVLLYQSPSVLVDGNLKQLHRSDRELLLKTDWVLDFVDEILRLFPCKGRVRVEFSAIPGVCVFAVVLELTLYECSNSFGDICKRLVAFSLVVAVAVSTVRSLYAGTLATIWTTAPSLPQRRSPSAQLAAVCLFLATLTIAARCYASSNATHPLVQLNPRPSSFSPIENSNAQIHSSNLVLSRLLTSPHQLVQSDTSVIVINSKQLLHNQNSNSSRNQFRTKRELKSSVFNYITSHGIRTEKSKSHDVNQSLLRRDKPVTELAGVKKNAEVFGARTSRDNLGINFKYKRPSNVRTVLNLEKRSDSEYVLSGKNNSVGASGKVNATHVNNSLEPEQHKEDNAFLHPDASSHSRGTARPMPPVHDHGNASSVSDLGILVLVLSAVVLTVALGLVTCVLSHYRSVAGEGAADGGTAADPHDAAQTPTTAPMLSVVSAGAAAGVGGMDHLRGGRAARELAASRDRQVRLHAVHTDIAINLPPSIAMPDGEEHPYTSSRLHLRDPEQEAEIHQKCIRPPPNRTVLESESPPPYRSSSAGLLGSTSSSSSTSSTSSGVGGGGVSDWSGGSAPLVVRCHSMSSSTSKRPEAGSSGQKTDFLQRTVKIFTGGGKKTGGGGGSGSAQHHQSAANQTLPVVIVPSRPRRTSNDQHNSTTTGRPKPSV